MAKADADTAANKNAEASKNRVIDFQDIKISYMPQAPVVSGVTLQVNAGECFGLAGLNGAGKTTLIKVMLGLRDADEGHASVFGGDFKAPQICRRVAYLPERFEPPWFLSGLEFIKFSLKLYSRPWDQTYIFAQAQQLGLMPEVLKRRTHTYSKGMRQKLGLLATMTTGCDLLVLDEPMSGLDPLARVQVKNLITRLNKQGVTVFFSSHILSDMQEICSRMAVLDGGRIRVTGTPDSLIKTAGADNLESAFLHYVGEVEKDKAA